MPSAISAAGLGATGAAGAGAERFLRQSGSEGQRKRGQSG